MSSTPTRGAFWRAGQCIGHVDTPVLQEQSEKVSISVTVETRVTTAIPIVLDNKLPLFYFIEFGCILSFLSSRKCLRTTYLATVVL